MNAAGNGIERVTVMPPAVLDADLLAHWEKLQADDPQLANPFFSAGYARLIGRCRPTARVAVMEQGGRVIGFFAYEVADNPEHGLPIGTIFCDYQGVIADRNVDWAPVEMVGKCGLRTWRFDHMLAWQTRFASHHQRRDVSWVIDLSDGFASYADNLRALGHQQLRQARRKARMLTSQHGPLRFSFHERDHVLLDHLLDLKSAQWAHTGWSGRFTAAWERRLMHDLLETDEPNFAGVLSVLRAGERPVAMHIGMRSRTVWHWWTTVYEPAFAHYSPGILLLAAMMEHAEDHGLRQIDLGKEAHAYKQRLANLLVPLAEGEVCLEKRGGSHGD